MAGARLRKSIIVLGVIAVAAVSAYVLSGSPANAAQPGGGSGPCWHIGVSDWTCPDSMAASSADYITSVSVTIETRDGRRVTRRLPAGVDAMFLTRSATEKFLLSYYWATNKEKAEALTRRLTAIREPAAAK